MRVGLDIGGTNTDVVALDQLGQAIQSLRVPTGLGASTVAETAEHAVRELASLIGCTVDDFESVGIGVPGVVDPETGQVRHAVNLGVDDLDLADPLARRLGVPVRVENDVNAAAYGACHLLELEGSAALLNLGTGLAAGIVIDGQVSRGAAGGTGEIGHIPVDPAGVICSCGQRGCLETVASGAAIGRMWPTDAPIAALELFDRADAGDVCAVEVREIFATGVASAIRVLVLTVDVQTVVLGGGLSNLGDRLLDAVTEILRRWENGSAFLSSRHLPERVRLLPVALHAATIGAALIGATGLGVPVSLRSPAASLD
jgi:predicted NBD/HSP70 family sugar kinase